MWPQVEHRQPDTVMLAPTASSIVTLATLASVSTLVSSLTIIDLFNFIFIAKQLHNNILLTQLAESEHNVLGTCLNYWNTNMFYDTKQRSSHTKQWRSSSYIIQSEGLVIQSSEWHSIEWAHTHLGTTQIPSLHSLPETHFVSGMLDASCSQYLHVAVQPVAGWIRRGYCDGWGVRGGRGGGTLIGWDCSRGLMSKSGISGGWVCRTGSTNELEVGEVGLPLAKGISTQFGYVVLLWAATTELTVLPMHIPSAVLSGETLGLAPSETAIWWWGWGWRQRSGWSSSGWWCLIHPAEEVLVRKHFSPKHPFRPWRTKDILTKGMSE